MIGRPARGLTFAAAVCAASGLASARSAAQPLRVGASRAPDTVRVGDPFRVLLRVAAPPGAHVIFPTAADSAAPVEVIAGPKQRTAAAPGGGTDVTAEYSVVAWTTGAVPVTLDSVIVRTGTAVRRVAMPPLAIVVRSVLPADSAQRVPKAAREPLPDFGRWWLRYALIALALLALVAALIFIAWRRLRRRGAEQVTGDDPYGRALAGFMALDRRGLVALGEGGRHVAVAIDLLRDYLVARFAGVATTSQTSGELTAALAPRAEVPADTLMRVLAAGDLVKFAAAPVAAEHATRYAAAARALVESTEAALRAREAQEAAAAEAQARADAEARRAYEVERRRAARAADAAAREDRAA